MRLICISNYRSDAGQWKKGDVLDVSESIAQFLLNDSPGSFSFEEEPKATPSTTGANRQQKGGHAR